MGRRPIPIAGNATKNMCQDRGRLRSEDRATDALGRPAQIRRHCLFDGLPPNVCWRQEQVHSSSLFHQVID